MTIAPQPVLWPMSRSARSRSTKVWPLSALSFSGRLNVTTATRSSRSSTRMSPLFISPHTVGSRAVVLLAEFALEDLARTRHRERFDDVHAAGHLVTRDLLFAVCAQFIHVQRGAVNDT